MLKEQLQRLIQLWHLSDVSPLPCGPHVFKAYQADQARTVVLKLARSATEFNQEVLTLQHYQGLSSVMLFAMDAETQAILMEYAHPGVSLKHLFPEEDAEAVRITAALIQRLHQLPLNNAAAFPQLENWLKIFKHERNHVLPQRLLAKASALAEALITSTTQKVLLHADLHHQNILASDRAGYLAIDPHGVVGDPAFEIAAFMRNPIPDLLSFKDIKKILSQRLDLFSALLNFDLERLRAWSFVGAMLSAAWHVEDQQPFAAAVQMAEFFN